jgi:hypothetical protein
MKQILDIAFSSNLAFMGFSIVLFISAFISLFVLFKLIFLMLHFFNMLSRTVNIWIRGWPPAHCDSAGNIIKTIVVKEIETEEQ